MTALAPRGGIIIGGPRSGHPVPGAWLQHDCNRAQDGDGEMFTYCRRVFTLSDGTGAVAHYIREGTADDVVNAAARRFFVEVRDVAEGMAAQPRPAVGDRRGIDQAALSTAVDEAIAQVMRQRGETPMTPQEVQDYIATRAVAWSMVLATRFGVGQFGHAVVAGPDGVAITVTRRKAKRR